ncbi:hypothetical protein [Sphingopyxis sp.]|uniref:hypothetical protein n=1 Tax=Sphingopyxis sp. TaxID=1908224 RepID=UPI003D129A7B
MADAASAPRKTAAARLLKWGGAAALGGSLIFIGERLWGLDWSTLQPHLSVGLVGGIAVGTLLFAAADRALAHGWTALADLDRTFPPSDMRRIYARGVLLKYLPGSIFQYVSRQVEGSKSGIEHKTLAKSAVVEVGLHLVSSMSVAAACLTFDRSPVAAIGAATLVVGTSLVMRRPLLTALAFQILAFGAFAAAAALVGSAVLPAGASLAQFAALFLLAWLAGFIVPVAPGGLGVREAALLALAGGGVPAAGLMAATLALRVSSIAGDLVYGLATLQRRRRN